MEPTIAHVASHDAVRILVVVIGLLIYVLMLCAMDPATHNLVLQAWWPSVAVVLGVVALVAYGTTRLRGHGRGATTLITLVCALASLTMFVPFVAALSNETVLLAAACVGAVMLSAAMIWGVVRPGSTRLAFAVGLGLSSALLCFRQHIDAPAWGVLASTLMVTLGVTWTVHALAKRARCGELDSARSGWDALQHLQL